MGAGALLYKLLAGSLIGLLAFVPPPSGSVQDRVIPSEIIRAVRFTDQGRTYMVDLETGRVTTQDDEIEPDPTPVPPKPVPPEPEPQPEPAPVPPESDIQLSVRAAFMRSIPASRRKEAAGCLWHAIEVTLAEAGGLGYDAQKIIDELKNNADFVCDQKLKGFDLGAIFAKHRVSDRAGVIKALRDTMAVMETLK